MTADACDPSRDPEALARPPAKPDRRGADGAPISDAEAARRLALLAQNVAAGTLTCDCRTCQRAAELRAEGLLPPKQEGRLDHG